MSHFFSVAARKLATFLGTFFVFALFAACSSQTSETPESVTDDYIKAVAENRLDEALGYFARGDAKEKDEIKTRTEDLYLRLQEKGGFDSVSSNLVDKNDDGTRTRVEVEVKYKSGDTDSGQMDLIKESGKWKIQLR